MRFVYGLAGLALATTGAFVFWPHAEPPAPGEPLSFRVSYWQERVEKKGGKDAYGEFAESVQGLPITSQHAAVHAFGGALFEAEGVDGLSVCDERFSYGCFHEFLGRAIKTLGKGTIQELNDKCFNALSQSPLSCQHGIGHGVLAAYGYEKESLDAALHECGNLRNGDPIGGCFGGAFMEYNVRTMLGDTVPPREYANNPFEPCDSLEDTFKTACIYWQPQWWTVTVLFSQSPEERFRKMGDYCRTFGKTETLHRSCFEGVGNIVEEQSRGDTTRARALCDIAGKTDTERMLCRSIGANHFGIDVGLDAATALCDGLAESAHEYCMEYAHNGANILNTKEIPDGL